MVSKLKYFIVVPALSASFDAQISNCFIQVDEKLRNAGLNKSDVLKLTVFVKTASNQQYQEFKQKATNIGNQYFEGPVPFSIISQYPENDCLVSMEFVFMNGSSNAIKRLNGTYNGQPYLKLVSEDCMMVFASGVCAQSGVADILKQSEAAFELVQGILENEMMSFSNILRQWNYIEKIIDFDETHGQHYQVFNDVRSFYYSKCSWEGGYPAATGIGTQHGGVVIDFIAVKPLNNCFIVPIKSPVQTDAHQYSRKVLEKSNVKSFCCKTSPKFERAKILMNDTFGQLYVSGTAAIKGEETIANMDVEAQLIVTLKNIGELCSNTNLLNHSVPNMRGNSNLVSARVYVKDFENLGVVKEAFRLLMPSCETIFVCGQICRPDLLVEVEGVVDVQLMPECV